MNTVEETLIGARDRISDGRIPEAVSMLEAAVAFVQQNPHQPIRVAATISELSSLVDTGRRFWDEWARLIAPNVALYTSRGGLTTAPDGSSVRVRLHG